MATSRTQIEWACLITDGGTPATILDEFRIGRDRTNDLQVDCADVSRHHAIIRRHGRNEYRIFDQNSTNGVRVNGALLARPRRLADGDRITIGRACFRFRQSSSEDRKGPSSSAAGSQITERHIETHACWLLIADIEGYTKLNQHQPPANVRRLFESWIRRSDSILEEHDGVLIKLTGDGFLAYWHDHPDVRPGIAAALEKLREFQKEEDPKFRIAVHLGTASFAGRVGGDFMIMSPDVIFVFRMEMLAKALRAPRIISAPVARILKHHMPVRYLGTRSVHGFSRKFGFHAF